ncbi:MAG: cell division protein FtsQ/DivIB [Candidatus Omnitrophica bacterium]|nr:cell division protein FtsQ/DivIB [Candidatus Omnitrophota bacterium]
MTKQKKKVFPSWIIKSSAILTVIVLSLAVCLFAFDRVVNYFNKSKMFNVKSIMIDPALQFIQHRDLEHLHGKNIFKLDLQREEQTLLMKYPQISELKVERRYPNQIHLAAKKRNKLAQFEHHNRFLVIDDEGIILSSSEKKDDDVPLLEGARLRLASATPGEKINNPEVMAGLEIIRAFTDNTTLSSYKILRVDVDQVSKILLYLDNDVNAILDDQKINYKMQVLGIVLTQGNLNPKEVNYIDLRFNEPIIGKK